MTTTASTVPALEVTRTFDAAPARVFDAWLSKSWGEWAGPSPVRGEVVQAVPGFEFHVLDADPRRVKRVRVTRKRAGSVRRRERKPEGEAASVASDRQKAPEQQAGEANAD